VREQHAHSGDLSRCHPFDKRGLIGDLHHAGA
jgi:hypothetical protein